MWITGVKNFILDLLFPKFCLVCQKEGNYLCEDCQSTLDILQLHQKCKASNLEDLYWAVSYKNPLIKNLIQKFKYEPFVKELAKPLTSLIINHFQLLDKKPNFTEFILVPLPLDKKRRKWRGFNQAAEIAKELSHFLKIPLILDCLIETRGTLPQVELSDEERKENIKGAFACKNSGYIQGKKILLVDDVYTTGATMAECARILKIAGAKEIVGIVIARG